MVGTIINSVAIITGGIIGVTLIVIGISLLKKMDIHLFFTINS